MGGNPHRLGTLQINYFSARSDLKVKNNESPRLS